MTCESDNFVSRVAEILLIQSSELPLCAWPGHHRHIDHHARLLDSAPGTPFVNT